MDRQKPYNRGDGSGWPAERLLSRLEKVKSVGQGRWQACCPAHDDHSPSLSIKEASDGTLLVKCWCGCSALEVVQAAGLTLVDLFPAKPDQARPVRRIPSPAAIEFERLVVAIGQAQLAQGGSLAPQDQARFELAQQRLQALKPLGVQHGR